MLRKVAEYLGLAPDEEYEDYDEYPERAPAPAPTRTGHVVQPPNTSRSAVTAIPVRQPAAEDEIGRVAPVRTITPNSPQPDTGIVVTRPANPTRSPVYARPVTLSPSGFGDAQEIADKFMANQPVIMNLEGLERDLSRRLIDFASGLCYGLSGTMKKVANQVFLLTPADVEVPAEDRRRLGERELGDS
jgi:cell division inhibitor SepF